MTMLETNDFPRAALKEDLSFSRVRPKSTLGSVNFSLGEKKTVRAVGAVYGIEYHLETKDFNARIYLDRYNQRLIILEFTADNFVLLIEQLEHLAHENRMDKLIYCANTGELCGFLDRGFVEEAQLQSYHHGQNAFMLSKFLSQKRAQSAALDEENELLKTIEKKKSKTNSKSDRYKNFRFRIANDSDIPELLRIYRKVFASYPSPLTIQDYFESIFQTKSIFYVATKNISEKEHILSVASAELFPQAKAAEITDCATLPGYRGNGLMIEIISCLEEELRNRNYVCAFSHARARSFGMNLSFSKLGYAYRGRMINNCDIYGAFEDMNIWEKNLQS